MRVAFVVPADLERPTGGNRYDVELASALAGPGVDVELRPVEGTWPAPTTEHRRALAVALTGPEVVLVDGLLACGAPAEIEAAPTPVHALVHMPLALDVGLTPQLATTRDACERRALYACAGVIATSAWTAADLRQRHGLSGVVVATPGTAPAALAVGSTPPQLLQLAAVTPVKNQLTVVEALARVTDLPWTALLAGPLDVDRAYVAAVRERITALALGDRVTLAGPRTGGELDRTWTATDVLLLPSRAETWGMVVTEALARGVPALVGAGTGAVEALGALPDGRVPGAVADPGSPVALAAALRHLLGASAGPARAAARERRATLPGWSRTAAVVQEALATRSALAVGGPA